MSYILDALKKSELKRNGEDLPSWSQEDVASVTPEPTERQRATLWILLALTPVLLFLVYWVFFRSSGESSLEKQGNLPETVQLDAAQGDVFSENLSEVIVDVGQDSQTESTVDILRRDTTKPDSVKKRKTNLQAFYAAQGGAAPGRVAKTGKSLTKKSTKRRPSVVFSDVPLDMEPSVKPKQKATKQIIAAGKDVVTVFELPLHVQKKLPELLFSGHVYSSDSKKRHIMINGQKIREGDAAEPGILVEKITLFGAVFRYRDWHFSLDALQDWEGSK